MAPRSRTTQPTTWLSVENRIEIKRRGEFGVVSADQVVVASAPL